jgi:hypothetical protein
VTVAPTVHPRPAGTDPALASSKHEEGLAVTEQTAPQYGSAGRTEEASGWALTAIAIDIFVIWALAAHGRDVAA